METTSKPDWLTPKQIAGRLDVTAESVRAWCRAGLLKALRAGRQYRIRPDDLESFLEHRETLEVLP